MEIFNGHSDIITDLHYGRLRGENHIFRTKYLDKFKEGNVKGSIFVIWIDETQFHDKLNWSKGLLETASLLFKENQDILNQVLTFDDYLKGKEEGKINIVLGMEGLDQIADDLDLIDQYYHEFGIRHMSLTWNGENLLGRGPDFKGGLTGLGKKALTRIEDLGIIMDVSHLNDDGFWDMVDLATKPLLASHSNGRELADRKRNLGLDQLRALRDQGGYIGINGFGEFVSHDEDRQDLIGLVDQIKYLVDIMGIERVTFGFDFCDSLPKEIMGSMVREEERHLSTMARGLTSEKEIPNLIGLMRESGFTEGEIERVAYRNYEEYLSLILK